MLSADVFSTGNSSRHFIIKVSFSTPSRNPESSKLRMVTVFLCSLTTKEIKKTIEPKISKRPKTTKKPKTTKEPKIIKKAKATKELKKTKNPKKKTGLDYRGPWTYTDYDEP